MRSDLCALERLVRSDPISRLGTCLASPLGPLSNTQRLQKRVNLPKTTGRVWKVFTTCWADIPLQFQTTMGLVTKQNSAAMDGGCMCTGRNDHEHPSSHTSPQSCFTPNRRLVGLPPSPPSAPGQRLEIPFLPSSSSASWWKRWGVPV